MRKLLSKALFISVCMLFSSPVFAGTKQELAQLKKDFEQFKKTYIKNNQSVADVAIDIKDLQRDLKSLQGQLQTAGMNKVEKDSTYSDLEKRVLNLENKVSQFSTLFKAAEENSQQGTDGAGIEYKKIIDMSGQGHHREAIAAWLGFIKKYPQDTRSLEAQYWIAENYYSMQDYSKAIAEFQKYAEKKPRSKRIATVLFRQGSGFYFLKSYPEAKLFFNKIIESYPRTNEAKLSKNQIKRIDAMLSKS